MISPADDPDDARQLEAELRRRVTGEVRFDVAARGLYSTDASNYRQIPIGVVIPRTKDDVEAAVSVCHAHSVPVLPRGGGTSLSGQTCNVAVVLDLSKYVNRLIELDPDRRTARIEPGIVLDHLRDSAETHGLTFGPDPATHNRCTLGGMIGNNSCGVHSLMAGKTDANVEWLDILTYQGTRLRVDANGSIASQNETRVAQIVQRLRDLASRYEAEIRARFPDIPRRVSGYDLPHLLPERFNPAGALVGTEGTCMVVLEAGVRLTHSPPARALTVIGFHSVFDAADAVPDILELSPIGLEGMDDRMISDMKVRKLHLSEIELLPAGGGWLLVEFGADSEPEARQSAERLLRLSRRLGATEGRVCRDRTEATRLWEVRESALGATAVIPGKLERWPGWDDSAVAPHRMGGYLRDLQKLMDHYDYDGAFYGHFGEGCLHVRYNFDLTSAPGIARFRAFVQEATKLVVSYGGSISGEHGDGQSHGDLLEMMYGESLVRAFGEFKRIWDPDGKMNPGKVVDANPPTADLRLGTAYHPAPVKTYFSFRNDANSFANATLRCVGVGKCRRHEGGVMCPSYMATHEEEHSTRGRARLLFEMLRGDHVRDGWRSEAVREALDLCLACKACKTECPVGVDMASYKAEFLAHYYRRRIRPRSAYAMGLIHWWARLASLSPRTVNRLAEAAPTSTLIKASAGIAPARSMPRFAAQTFRQTFRPVQNRSDRPRVLLWPDTFNNHFHPETARAAVSVLERAGFAVSIPRSPLCCGRPLYDFGMLSLAKHLLRRILDELRTEIRAETPIVVLEPSCASVFRDELLNLFPDDPDAAQLAASTHLLGEFLDKGTGKSWGHLTGRALIQGHCHQTLLGGIDGEASLLAKLGLDVQVLDAGCCGMAGAFGFEADHYEVSVACARRALLPALQSAGSDVLVVADGFSCREQIRQLAGRDALHLADVLQRAG